MDEDEPAPGYDFRGATFDLGSPGDREIIRFVLSQALYGEATGVYCGRSLYAARSLEAAQFYARQARQELNHLQLFAEIFDLTVKPSEGRFAQVPIDEHLTIDFADDEHTRGILHFVPEQLESHHYAFHVTDEEFDGIFGRVKAKGLAYGSGPTTETDGQVADRRGGRAFYFRELNGHLLEVMTA